MPTPSVFSQFRLRQQNGNAKNLVSASIKVGLVKSTYTPNVSTDALFSTIISGGKEVTGTNYTAGGVAITGSAVALDAGSPFVPVWVHDDVTWAQHASGFADARYAVWYDTADSRVILLLDLGADRGNVNGPLSLDIDAVNGLVAF